MLVGESRILDYVVPHKQVNLKYGFQPTSEARRTAAVWTIQFKKYTYYYNETSGSSQAGDHNRPNLILSYQLCPPRATLSISDKAQAVGEDRSCAYNHPTKAVTQFVQFLHDHRAGDTLIEQGNVMDEDELESDIPF